MKKVPPTIGLLPLGIAMIAMGISFSDDNKLKNVVLIFGVVLLIYFIATAIIFLKKNKENQP
jgi:hypothetical protein